MKRTLVTAAVAAVLLAQPAPSFAGGKFIGLPKTQGLCWAMPQWWQSWLPCFDDPQPDNGLSGGIMLY